MNPMTYPTEQEIQVAFDEHVIPMNGEWAFRAHPMNVYSEAQIRDLIKVNLMLGTTPNGSLGTGMLLRIVERIAALERRNEAQDDAARGAREMGA